jgi:hypothetical protein
MLASCLDHALTRAGNGTLIEVVIAKHKVNRLTECFDNPSQLKNDIIAFGNIATDQHSASRLSADRIDPTVPLRKGDVVQVRIGGPNQSHHAVR